MVSALTKLPEAHNSRVSQVLFGKSTPSPVTPIKFTPFDVNLNGSQIEAIEFALGSQDTKFLH